MSAPAGVRRLLFVLGVAIVPLAFLAGGALNPGQCMAWIAFLASLVAGIAYLAVMGGRDSAEPFARAAFQLQWLAYVAAAAVLWVILFNHQFQYQYVASYSSRAMPGYYVFSAFWGGQEGTFMLWALITCTLGLVLMRVRDELSTPAMFFLNLPLIMLGLVTVMRGPFLTFAAGQVPPDGNGLNPLLQDPWMTIHPPVLFAGFSLLAVPFAIAIAALVRRNYDGWIRPVLPWVLLSTAVLATGFIMGGVWAYKVLGWGGYWGWDPVENGSLIPWLSNTALLHGLLVQRVTGSLRRTNFFLAVTSFVLVLYASFLTRSGVLADFSVHSFVNLGLNGFLLSFLFLAMLAGYGLLFVRLRDIPPSEHPIGDLSRESMMWLGQLVLVLICVVTAVGMSAPLITSLFHTSLFRGLALGLMRALGAMGLGTSFIEKLLGPPFSVQSDYYNMVNAPLAVALGLLLGIAPLMRWRRQEAAPLLRAALPPLGAAVVIAVAAIVLRVRDPLAAAVVFAAAWALAANAIVTVSGFRAGWRHGLAPLGHAGVGVLLIGVVASSMYGRSAQVQLPAGQERAALGYRLRFDGMRQHADGKDRAMIAVHAPEGSFEAAPALYWSDFNQGYMKKPHIERFLTHDIYIAPLDLVGDEAASGGVWFARGESREIGRVKYTFEDFDVTGMGTPQMRIMARMTVESGGRTVPVAPGYEPLGETPHAVPAYLPGGSSVQIAGLDAANGRVKLELPGAAVARGGGILAVEVSTKPLMNLVWIGSILMLGSAFLAALRRALDARGEGAES